MFEQHTEKELKGLGYVEPRGLGKVKFDVYKIVADKFLDSLKKEGKAWVKEWAEAQALPAINFVSKKPYQGYFNKLMTSQYASPQEPYFLTEKQIEDKKGKVIDPNKGVMIFFFKKFLGEKTKKDKEGNEKKELVYLATLKHYIVYHQSNIEGVEFPKHEMPNIYQHDQIDSAEAIIKSMPKRPKLQNDNSGRAFYSPARDIVNMPEIGLFTKPQSYYSTYFHELAHSTKHESRLGKRKTAKYKASTFGDAGYAYEELIAEISATFLSADAGILNFTFENSVAYTKGWLQDYNKLVKNDPKAVYNAIREAEKVAKFINTKQIKLDVVKPEKPKQRIAIHRENEPITKPNKAVKASLNQAINDVVKLNKYSKIGAMALNFLYKNKDQEDIEVLKSGYNKGMFKKLAASKCVVDYDIKFYDNIIPFEITGLGRDAISAVEGRLQSLRMKKEGAELFPNLAGTSEHKDTTSFNKQIIKAKRSGVEPNDLFNLGKSKGVLLKITGATQITVSGAVIIKSMTKDKDHILDFQNLINLPDSINSPLAIFRSKTQKGAFIVLTEIKTYKEKKLMVALHINNTFKISKIASIYNRARNNDYRKWYNEGLCVYVSKKEPLNQLLPGTIPLSPIKRHHKDTK